VISRWASLTPLSTRRWCSVRRVVDGRSTKALNCQAVEARPSSRGAGRERLVFPYQKSKVTLNRANRAFSTVVGDSHVEPLVTGSYVWL